jgi:hypothetical protein
MCYAVRPSGPLAFPSFVAQTHVLANSASIYIWSPFK